MLVLHFFFFLKDNCSPLEEMKSSVSKCTSDYSIETEDKTNYCKGKRILFYL